MLAYFTYFFSFQSCRKLDKNSIFLPSYHTVSNQELPHIKPLYPYKSVAQFERELDFILKNYKSISLYNLETYTEKTPAFHLTFDDGLSECYEVIMPILLQKGIHATFFINNDFVDNKSLFYRFKTALLINGVQANRQNLELLSKHLHLKADFEIVRKKLLSLNHQQTNDLNNMADLIGLDFAAFLNTQKPYLSTEQIHEMISKGFTIGAHSQSHPHYDNLDLQEQLQETKASILRAQKDFNLSYTAFAFPFSDDKISEEFIIKIKELFPTIQLFGIKGIKPHMQGYYNRYIMELHTQKSPELALKYLYLKSIYK